MNDKRIRFAIVGCGRISAHHAKAIAAHGDRAELAAVCDVVPERASRAAEEAGGIPWYDDYGKMLAAGGFDAVSICTPSGLHPEQGIQAAEAGFHVITEKPMAISLEPADRLIKTCDDKGVRLFVVKQNRLNSTVRMLKQAVDKGRFGRICFAEVNVFWTRPQEYYDMAPWRGTKALDGGAFMNQASHYVDLMHWLLGDVDEVDAFRDTLVRDIEMEDTGAAILRFKSGALGTFNVTMLVYPKNLEGSITVIGTRGTARIGGIALNRIETWDFDQYADEDREVLDTAYNPPTVYGHGHKGYYENVIDVLQGKAQPRTDGRSGRHSLELILAMYRAAQTGQRVKLPLT
ncbi:MAG: Gfo/Idh/MocA family oxidoreductase [Deltaproteobacteria bacterium]|nr:Gfo/Idh/MocA family oxidoreductase [Deltaproteobacteria bacterium]